MAHYRPDLRNSQVRAVSFCEPKSGALPGGLVRLNFEGLK